MGMIYFLSTIKCHKGSKNFQVLDESLLSFVYYFVETLLWHRGFECLMHVICWTTALVYRITVNELAIVDKTQAICKITAVHLSTYHSLILIECYRKTTQLSLQFFEWTWEEQEECVTALG